MIEIKKNFVRKTKLIVIVINMFYSVFHLGVLQAENIAQDLQLRFIHKLNRFMETVQIFLIRFSRLIRYVVH